MFMEWIEIDSGSSEVKNLLDKLVVLKFNGGLGTTMGCTGPKYAQYNTSCYFYFYSRWLSFSSLFAAGCWCQRSIF